MTIIGALVRVDTEQRAVVWQALAQLPGVSPFALDDAAQLGLIIEAANLDDGYRLLQDTVPRTPGVLTVSPAYAHFE